MNNIHKEFLLAWGLVIAIALVSGTVGYFIGNDPTLDKIEEQIEELRIEASEVNAQCFEELDRYQRLLQREVNILQAPNTNGR